MSLVERIVAALRKVESGGSPLPWPTGDQGRALGPWQCHPDFFAQWYKPHIGDTWLEAMEKAVEACVTHYFTLTPNPTETAMAFHVGHVCHPSHPCWDAGYAKRFQEAYGE